MKNSKIIFFAALAILGEILWLYLCGWFVSQNANPQKWAIEGRVLMVIAISFTIVITTGYVSDLISKNKP